MRMAGAIGRHGESQSGPKPTYIGPAEAVAGAAADSRQPISPPPGVARKHMKDPEDSRNH